MSIPLSEALEHVDLVPGSIYCCKVKGYWVEVRVLKQPPTFLAEPFAESDIMPDSGVNLPGTETHRQTAKGGVSLPFDVPEIPAE